MSLLYEVDGREIEITNPERILFPQSKITKRELVDYYSRISPIMIPHMKDRAVTMHRFPEGIAHEGFYHKDVPDYFPKWIKTKTVKKKEDGTVKYVVCNDAATLIYLAQQACITPHIWLSKIDRLRFPDRMIFDLDPEEQPFSFVRSVALKMKYILERIDLIPFAMTTGSKGMHVTVPINPDIQFSEVREFARAIATHLVQQQPEKLTLEIRKEKRRGRLFVDVLRNSFGATGVAPYAVRAREGAPIATPLSWDEVHRSDLAPDKYTIKNIFRRLARIEDPWKDIDRSRRSVHSAQKKFSKLMGN